LYEVVADQAARWILGLVGKIKMKPQKLRFPVNGGSLWAGMGDFELESPNGEHLVLLSYEGEPPHGDSYHRVLIDGRSFPGYAWGCRFAFTADSRYLAFSWMAKCFERKTVIVDVVSKRYFVLPEYVPDIRLEWPSVQGDAVDHKGHSYTFTGGETWVSY
jgi:hypothetical protein